MSQAGPKQQLMERLRDQTAVIGVVGLGYVGLPLALRYAEAGFKVIGFDVDPAKTERIGAGESYIRHIPSKAVRAAVANGFEAVTTFERAPGADALILCLPTPLDRHREPDLSFVLATVESLVPHLREGQVVSLESTTWPGTTDEELGPRIASTGLTIGRDVFLVYSPEREDPGNPRFTTRTIPKVVGGLTPACLEVGQALYAPAIDRVVPVSSTRAAEMAKLLENIHRAVNIGLVNEMKMVADRMGIDIFEVIEAAGTKPFGFVPYYPGPGLGGHCIPVDPFYLTWKAREFGVNARFIELAGEINSGMPGWVVNKVIEGLNRRERALNGSRILVLGIAYKKNVADTRESPGAEIIRQLQDGGAEVDYSDPHVPVFPRMRRYDFTMQSRTLDPEALSAYDCAVLVTDHEAFDYDMILAHSRLVVDTRGVFRPNADRVVRA